MGDVGEDEGKEEVEKGCKSVDDLLSTMCEEEASNLYQDLLGLFSYPIARASAPAPRVFTLKDALEVHFRGRDWPWNL